MNHASLWVRSGLKPLLTLGTDDPNGQQTNHFGERFDHFDTGPRLTLFALLLFLEVVRPHSFYTSGSLPGS